MGNGTEEIIIKFKPEVKKERISEILNELAVKEVDEIEAINVKVVKLLNNKTIEDISELAKGYEEIEYIEPNYEAHLCE